MTNICGTYNSSASRHNNFRAVSNLQDGPSHPNVKFLKQKDDKSIISVLPNTMANDSRAKLFFEGAKYSAILVRKTKVKINLQILNKA